MKFTCFLFIFFLIIPVFAQSQEVLTWGECVNEAKLHHPDLISSREKLNQVKASKKEAMSVLFPQISSGFNMGSSQTDPYNKVNSYSYDISARQLLFNGLKNVYDIYADSEYVKAAQFNYYYTSAQVRQNLRTAFVQLLISQELLKITEDITKRRGQNLELVRTSYEAGSEHKGSLLTAQADYAQAQLNVVKVKRNIKLYQQQVLTAMGRDNYTAISVKEDIQLNFTNEQEPNFRDIANINPSLKALIAQKQAAKYNVSSAKSSFYPEISASGGFGRSSSIWPPDRNQWSVGLNLSLPLFKGGQRVAEVARIKAVLAQINADEKGLRNSIIYNLAQNWISLQNARDGLQVQKQFLIAAEERAKIAQAQYSIGLLSFNEWTIIEDALANNQTAFLNSQSSILTAEANWVLSRGGTLEEK